MEKKEGGVEDVSSTPGSGWSNGDVPLLGTMYTREGKVRLFQKERRWISLATSWARHTGDANDTHHASSARGESSVTSKEEEALTIKSLMSQMCEKFYLFGWMPGTGGGMALRSDDGQRVYCTPSGIQKEDMIGDDVFELNMNMEVTCPPVTPGLKLSSMTNLWFLVYKIRPQAKCVIHTHSLNAKLVTLLQPQKDTIKLSYFEMLKGVGNHGYADTLEIPIIENQPSESLLYEDMELAMKAFPKCNAVLVRRHGVYVWGDSWEQAKTQLESFTYLFETAIEMTKMGLCINPSQPIPPQRPGLYGNISPNQLEDDIRPKKRKRIQGEGQELNSVEATNNETTCQNLTSIPLLPKEGKVLLLDVKECAMSGESDLWNTKIIMSEVLQSYLRKQTSDDIKNVWVAMDNDVKVLEELHPVKVYILKEIQQNVTVEYKDMLIIYINGMMKHSFSSKVFNQFQKSVWKYAIETGTIKGHIYSDVKPMLEWMKTHNIPVHIYSSKNTAIECESIYWKHTNYGDLVPYITQFHNDGMSCMEVLSATSLSSVPKDQICLVSSNFEELSLANGKGGIIHSIYSIRPNNNTNDSTKTSTIDVHQQKQSSFPCIRSLLQICGSE